jgi:mRNA-degrading endonuclease RelE of RelBE toxin-antitoxin system
MNYGIEYLKSVVTDDIPRLQGRAKELIKTCIEKRLSSRPEVYGIPLRYSLKGLRKLRVSEYRVIFFVKGNVVTIVMIAHRSQVYEHLLRKIQ